MAGLSYDYKWSPIDARFNDANSLMATGSQTLSNVGDIFSKLADRIALRENQRAELALKEAGLDIERDKMLFDRDKLAQELAIAQMTDATNRKKIDAQQRRWDLEDERIRRDAEAWNMTKEKQKNIIEKNPDAIAKLEEEIYDKVGFYDELKKNRAALASDIERYNEAAKDAKKWNKTVYNSTEDYMNPSGMSYLLTGDRVAANPQLAEARQKVFEFQTAQNVLDTIMMTNQYQNDEEASRKDADKLISEKDKLGAELALARTPNFFAIEYPNSRAALGLSPRSELPQYVELPLELQYQKTTGKSGSSSNSSGKSGNMLFDGLVSAKKTIQEIGNNAKVNYSKLSKDKQQWIIDRALQLMMEENMDAVNATSEAFSQLDIGTIYDSMKDTPIYKGSR